MTKSILQVEECCGWCRRPVQRCRAASCDDAPTYAGILLRGVWNELRDPPGDTDASPGSSTTLAA